MMTGFQLFMVQGVILGIALGCFLHRLKSFGLLLIIIGVTVYYGAEGLNADTMSVFIILGGAIGIRLELRLFRILWVSLQWIRYGIIKAIYIVRKPRTKESEQPSHRPSHDDFWDDYRNR